MNQIEENDDENSIAPFLIKSLTDKNSLTEDKHNFVKI